jgi:hypothetical protein
MTQEPTSYNKFEVQTLLNLNAQDEFKLERVFDVYKQHGAKHFYYNILNTVNFPERVTPGAYFTYYTKQGETWTNISYTNYKRIDLWWIIAAMNQIDDTFSEINGGTKLMIPKPEVIRIIIDEIKQKI